MIKFDATKEELALIQKIIERVRLDGRVKKSNEINLKMNLCAVNANGCPLDFEKLLSFDDFSFYHDIYGIEDCLDRTTGKLTNCFDPRCSKPVVENYEKRK